MTWDSLNSELPLETPQCADRFVNSQSSPVNLFDFSDFSVISSSSLISLFTDLASSFCRFASRLSGATYNGGFENFRINFWIYLIKDSLDRRSSGAGDKGNQFRLSHVTVSSESKPFCFRL